MNFYLFHIALTNCCVIDNCTLKRPVTENKVYSNCRSKLNMAYVGACACNCTPLIVRPGFCVTMYIEITVDVFLDSNSKYNISPNFHRGGKLIMTMHSVCIVKYILETRKKWPTTKKMINISR